MRARTLSLDATTYKGITVTVIGDGQRYKFITRDTEEWNGLAWTWPFDTKKGKETTAKLPFSEARPTKFARTVPFVTLDKTNLCTVQFTLSKFEFDGDLNPRFNGDGPFCIDIKKIALY